MRKLDMGPAENDLFVASHRGDLEAMPRTPEETLKQLKEGAEGGAKVFGHGLKDLLHRGKDQSVSARSM